MLKSTITSSPLLIPSHLVHNTKTSIKIYSSNRHTLAEEDTAGATDVWRRLIRLLVLARVSAAREGAAATPLLATSCHHRHRRSSFTTSFNQPPSKTKHKSLRMAQQAHTIQNTQISENSSSIFILTSRAVCERRHSSNANTVGNKSKLKSSARSSMAAPSTHTQNPFSGKRNRVPNSFVVSRTVLPLRATHTQRGHEAKSK